MNEVLCKEVIVTSLLRRGKGDNELSPIRAVTQVYEKDGTLIAEHDPSPETFALFDLILFARFCAMHNDIISEPEKISPTHVLAWIKNSKNNKQ